MADAEIPIYRCTYCLQALTADDRQDLFGSDSSAPRSDDADNFAAETQTILRYAAAVASMCHEAGSKSEDMQYEMLMLMGELTDEAQRRLERVRDALAIMDEREQEAKKAHPSRNEGRA